MIEITEDLVRQLYNQFKLGHLTQEGKDMNEISTIETTEPDVVMVEILDAEGNPTGQYSPREAAPTEGTIYTTAEDGDREVTVH